METIGLILASVIGLVIAVFAGYVTGSIIVGIVVFIFAAGYLFSQWTEAGVPYDIHDIKKKLDDADKE